MINHKDTESDYIVDRPKPASVDLWAKVEFDGVQFIISNNNRYDWTQVEMEVNSGLFKGGYILRTPILKAGHEYTVGALQFAKSDGTRLNPWKVKPMRFSISCNTVHGDGSWHKEFK